MKKILITTFALMLVANCYCQELTFLDIPIKGSKAVFSKKLINKGFELIPNDDEGALSGLFLGEPCILKPQTDDNGEMNCIMVILLPDDNWPSLNVKYANIRKKLLNEMGSPQMEDHSFDMPTEPFSDIAKFQAVSDGKCSYYCLWMINDVGSVGVSINHLKSGENVVLVAYMKMDMKSIPLQHIKFKGISLGESPYTVVKALESQGYIYETKVRDNYLLNGVFAGYSNCRLFVQSAQYGNTVEYVAVNFPDQTKWEHLFNTYSNLQGMLTRKYGKPADCTEKFYTSKKQLSDNEKISLMMQDEYKYETVYFIEGGYVKLIINHLYVEYEHHFYVGLIYVDGATKITTSERAIDDL